MADNKKYEWALPIGTTINGGQYPYEVVDVLGHGGFGITYKVKANVLVRNIPFELHFAVKEYFPNICSREADNATMKIPETMQEEVGDGLVDFINEGERLQQVCKLNPNIVNVNEVFQANGTAYYVLEYLEGGDLRRMVRDNGKPLTEQQMLDVMLPIGHAVQCLHDSSMLHLDIKPDNIVMRQSNRGKWEPVLIDFGIAVHFRQDGTPTSKTPSQGISPGYSPIEQYSQVRRFDPRLDVYAYCATCLYLLTGRDPIEATDVPSDFVESALPAGISSDVAAAIKRGMAMNKSQRAPSINAVLNAMTGKDGISEAAVKTKKATPAPGATVNLEERAASGKQQPAANPPVPGGGQKPKQSLAIKEESARSSTYKPQGGSSSAGASREKPKKKFPLMRIAAIVLACAAIIGGIVVGAKRCSSSDGSGSGIASEEILDSDKEIVNKELTFTVNGISFTMVEVQGGTFTMGATAEQGSDAFGDEKPAHSVTLSSYYIGKTEVTQELWQAVMGNNPSYKKGAKLPVEQVSWDDCQKFIGKLNQKTGKNFRLPTEAEWEYAARGGNRSRGYKYSGSNNIDDVAWFFDNSGSTTHEVATKRANELGLYDMSGNVWEWCSDWYDSYSSSAQTNPTGPSSGSPRVFRGSCWGSDAGYCRVAYRGDDSPDFRYYSLGLRLAL